MTKYLPVCPSLEHLKNEAKSILKAHRRGDASCCDVLRNLHQFAGKTNSAVLAAHVGLQEVQHSLAVEYGFTNWAELKISILGPSQQDILFTVELSSFLEFRFRLQKDQSWRDCRGDRILRQTDFVTSSPIEVTAMSNRKGVITIDGTTFDIGESTTSWPRECESLFYESNVFRRTFPSIPSFAQLQRVIAAGDDSVHNCPILNLWAQFELRPSPPFNSLLNDPTVVVRHETCAQGNDYVGQEASQDESWMTELYLSSIEQWRLHLLAGETQSFSDYIPPCDGIDSVLTAIKKIGSSWMSQIPWLER